MEAVYLSSRTFKDGVPIHLSSFIAPDSRSALSSPTIQPLLICAELKLSVERPVSSIGTSVKQQMQPEVGKIRIITP
jgi:hypothetical protein